jgi:hypothetical protein
MQVTDLVIALALAACTSELVAAPKRDQLVSW